MFSKPFFVFFIIFIFLCHIWTVETASSESKTSQATKQDTLEFVSDTYDENLNDEELKKELQQLNLDTKKIEDGKISF